MLTRKDRVGLLVCSFVCWCWALYLSVNPSPSILGDSGFKALRHLGDQIEVVAFFTAAISLLVIVFRPGSPLPHAPGGVSEQGCSGLSVLNSTV
jgi:hypothetical protein